MASKHTDFIIVKELVFDKCDFELTNQKAEAESAEYGGCKFRLNQASIIYRASKITPTKTGQFVTIWKRNSIGKTESLNILDKIDFIIISSRCNDNFGLFIFPSSVLLKKRIISENNKEGKRGIRVYPPWDKVTNKQAERTQNWQVEYFLQILNDNTTDLIRAKKLLSK